jgi:hypothetical protein
MPKGIYTRVNPSGAKPLDLRGQRFGLLTAINPSEKIKGSKCRQIIWHCKCDCGNEHHVRGSLLKNGCSQSCGCRLLFRESLEKRFWKNVYVSDSCWEWMGSFSIYGYGTISVMNKPNYAHRLSWEMEFGMIQNGLFVCHHCDNPKCVNPYHLFIGTHQENMQDMVNKKRHLKRKSKILYRDEKGRIVSCKK